MAPGPPVPKPAKLHRRQGDAAMALIAVPELRRGTRLIPKIKGKRAAEDGMARHANESGRNRRRNGRQDAQREEDRQIPGGAAGRGGQAATPAQLSANRVS